MFYTGKPSTEDTVADETWFSDPAVCRDLQVWYQLSKTLAESAAWEFAKENDIDLVTINPGFVNGPFLQPTPTFSAEMVLNLVNGNATYPSYYYWSVDVRDVAEAHVKAFETESAHGRYCLVGSNADFPQVLQIIHQLYPTIDLPNKDFCIIMSSNGEGKVVCVTGASGYIASWLVKLLLHHGYTVNATVRDDRDPKKTGHLLELDGAKERLRLYRADLLEEGSFDSAVRGCDGVFHTASPVSFSAVDPQKEILDPAIKGTLNVLKSCAKSPSIKRVIVTSSTASMLNTGKPVTEDTVADETWFSDPAVCEQHKNWYPLSKTLAERVAWEFAKENNIDLITMHPGIVNGPFLQPSLTFSIEIVLNLVNGQLENHLAPTVP
ncbi:Phenylacetaldehyde reductase [Linum perenne]